MRQQKQLNAKTLWGGVIFWPLFLLAVTPLILATPAHATDDNTISISVDPSVALQPVGNLYKATTNVTVKTGKPYGFTLTMEADNSNLVNSNDPTRKISYNYRSYLKATTLGANQWGYSLHKDSTKFMQVPGRCGKKCLHIGNIAHVTNAKPHGCTNIANCTKSVTFAANVDQLKLAGGSYGTTVTYTATTNSAPEPRTIRTAKTSPSDVCRSGDPNSSCLVDLDPNMIPVEYTGDDNHARWTSVADPEAANSDWYDYGKKQWANAITVKPEALAKYKGYREVVDPADILGFWVYIPRYRYKVLRYSTSDPAVPAQNFTIEFENKQSTKAISTANGTWATHPAFTFGTKKLNGLDIPNELNGIWFAKFETTWNGSQPTVLPNEAHMSGYYTASYNIGRMYTTAKTLGVADSRNFGGNTDYSVPAPNNHHLTKFSSHMVNNNDWGAAAYLSASKYGAGYNKVQINANGANHSNSWGTTGCGPQSNGNTSSYSDSGTLGTPQACGNADRAYNGTLGQLASTTNNPTGIYDMSGGGWEYTASSYTSDLSNSATNEYFGSNAAHPPYVNTYNFSDPNSCTFATCGGQALYETNNGTNNSSTAQWNGNYMYFVTSSYPWFGRGGGCYNGSNAGLFSANGGNGNADGGNAFRVALAPLQD